MQNQAKMLMECTNKQIFTSVSKTGKKRKCHKCQFLARPACICDVAMATSNIMEKMVDILTFPPRMNEQLLKVSALYSKFFFQNLEKPYGG